MLPRLRARRRATALRPSQPSQGSAAAAAVAADPTTAARGEATTPWGVAELANSHYFDENRQLHLLL